MATLTLRVLGQHGLPETLESMSQKKKIKVTEEGGLHDRAAHEVVKGRVLCPVGTMRIILNLESEITNLGAPVENVMAQKRKRCEIEVALKKGGGLQMCL